MSAPVPPNRGRWFLTLHTRTFTRTPYGSTGIAQLDGATSRTLSQQWNAPAVLTFTLDGRSPAAASLRELMTEVVAWRWDDALGVDVAMFRGLVDACEDQITEQSHTVNVTCHDYLAMLARRYVTRTLTYAATDQDGIVASMLANAQAVVSTDGATAFGAAGFLPLIVAVVNADGTVRSSPSGQLRDRTYLGSSSYGTMLDDLAKVSGGLANAPGSFDYDVKPQPSDGRDQLRVFYPQQGVTRTDVVLEYGGLVAGVTRQAAAGDYANWWRVLGNSSTSAQLYAEAWNPDALNAQAGAIGLWMNTDNAADVSVGLTLTQQAQGDLNRSGVLVPAYTLTLSPGAYYRGLVNMGDAVPLVVTSGRLKVNTSVRVMGLTFDIGDDGQEDVEVTVGRPLRSLVDMLTAQQADVNALARR